MPFVLPYTVRRHAWVRLPKAKMTSCHAIPANVWVKWFLPPKVAVIAVLGYKSAPEKTPKATCNRRRTKSPLLPMMLQSYHRLKPKPEKLENWSLNSPAWILTVLPVPCYWRKAVLPLFCKPIAMSAPICSKKSPAPKSMAISQKKYTSLKPNQTLNLRPSRIAYQAWRCYLMKKYKA